MDSPWVHSGVRRKLGGIDCIAILTGPKEEANIFIPCVTDHAGAFRDAKLLVAAVNSYATHRALIAELVEALEGLGSAYISLLEKGRERIMDLGGQCDDVATMINAEPALRSSIAALTRAKEALK